MTRAAAPTVLIIDDDPAVRLLVRRTLERAGYSVVEASDGAQGVNSYRSAPTDVVITDVFMPGQDGIETIQQLRAEFPRARIIAMSGGTSIGAEGPLRDARLLGADATLPKPFSLDALTRTVAEVLESDG